MTTRIAVAGAGGKMGVLVQSVIEGIDGFETVARLGSSSPLSDLEGADLVVDVTRPDASPAIVEHAVAAGAKVLVGTSGWSRDRLAALEPRVAASPGAGVLVIPNFSLGSVLATTLATIASRFYSSIEIVESHRAAKADSPSGTAVRTAELIAEARGDLGPVDAPHVDQRARGQQVGGIPVHSLRLSGVVASQQVILGGEGETVTIRHDTIDPGSYREGIALSLRRAVSTTGVVVGLENVIDLGIGRP